LNLTLGFFIKPVSSSAVSKICKTSSGFPIMASAKTGESEATSSKFT